MINQPNYGDIKFTWQGMLWRLVLTVLLLVVLAGSAVTIFQDLTSPPGTQVLPAETHPVSRSSD